MDKWWMAGFALLVAGLVLVASAAVTISWNTNEVVVRDVVYTNTDAALLGPHYLAGGAYTIWLEDHPKLPEDAWRTPVSLQGNESDPVDYSVDVRRFQVIEGVRCIQVGDVDRLPEGDWIIVLVTGDIYEGTSLELDLFVLSSIGMEVTLIMAIGLLLVIMGPVTLVIKRVPKDTGPP